MSGSFNTLDHDPMQKLREARSGSEDPSRVGIVYRPVPGQKLRMIDGAVYETAMDGSIRNIHKATLNGKEKKAYRRALRQRARAQ